MPSSVFPPELNRLTAEASKGLRLQPTMTPYDPIVRGWEKIKRSKQKRPRILDSHIRANIVGNTKNRYGRKFQNPHYANLPKVYAVDSAHEKAELTVIMVKYIEWYRATSLLQRVWIPGRGGLNLEKGSVNAAVGRLWKRYLTVNGTGYLAVWLRQWDAYANQAQD